MNDTPKGKVKLYACGGGGTNIGYLFEKYRETDAVGFAQIEVVYIDTSRSNLHEDISAKHVYLLDGTDGSGSIRAENAQPIAERIRDVLQKHPPADLNIVLSTAAGGSGSVIAPELTSELLSRDASVVVIAIGSTESRLYASNTLKTLKSYEGVAKARKAPVVLHYVQNGATMPRSEVDTQVRSLVSALCALFSRENRELDSRDLFNWLRFDRSTTFPPQVAVLSLVDSSSDISGLGNVISVATLSRGDEHVAFPVMTDYRCAGFVPASAPSTVLAKTPLHFVTSDGIIGDVAGELSAVLREAEQSQQARIRKGGLLSSGDEPTASGLVL
jgi:hypothetical protein